MNRLALLLAAALALALPAVRAAEPFAFKDGDRVVLLGNTLIEREQRYGYWETALTSHFPGVTFRNLGWSGDTVWGEARAGFGTQADGFKHLKEHVLSLKPTVIVVGYGGNEAFDGPVGLPKFEKGLNDLLDALAPVKARVVLLSPTPHENLGPPLPDTSAQNKNLALYRDAIREAAKKRECTFVDLYALLKEVKKPLTDNGMHFTNRGYWYSALVLEAGLGYGPKKWSIDVSEGGAKVVASGVKVERAERKRLRFTVTSEELPAPDFHGPTTVGVQDLPKDLEGIGKESTGHLEITSILQRVLKVQGLPVGNYTLYIDGKKMFLSAPAKDWAKGLDVGLGPDFDQAEKLRQAIVEKNRLYFHRWRPQNETYLFGFRKAEQGKNAVEIPQFDPLIVAKEAEIAKLRVPLPHVYEIKPE